MQNHETELEAAERRIRNIPRCGAAKRASMEQSFLQLLQAIGEDPNREGLLRTPTRAARAFEESDRLRDELAALGWLMRDRPDGFDLIRA